MHNFIFLIPYNDLVSITNAKLRKFRKFAQEINKQMVEEVGLPALQSGL